MVIIKLLTRIWDYFYRPYNLYLYILFNFGKNDSNLFYTHTLNHTKYQNVEIIHQLDFPIFLNEYILMIISL